MSEPRRLIAERYRMIRPLGHGSTGSVHVAEDLRMDRTVAVKLIPAAPTLSDRDIARFANEASAPSDLQHEGIVRVFEAGYDVPRHSLFLAMELLHGETMRELLVRDAELDARLDAIEGLLAPLAIAHGSGVVHRNLKPENVFIARRRTGETLTTLLDVELVRILSEGSLLPPGSFAGTPKYMAPEHLTRGLATPASDVWSIGVMLYEALVGRLPFDEDHIEPLVHRVTQDAPPSIEAIDPTVEPAMARLVEFCLDKDPTRRPHDARAVMRLMKSLRGGAGSLARTGADGRVVHDTMIDPIGTTPDPPPAALEAALRRTPRDPAVHRAIAAHYQTTRNNDGVWLAASALEFLGAANADEMRIHNLYRKPAYGGLDRGLDTAGWGALVHPDQDPRIDAVWTEIADAVLAVHRRSDVELLLDRAHKLDLGKPSEELSRTFARAIGALRPGALPRLYRGRAGTPPRHLPALPLASVFPRGFEEPLPAGALPFAIGRHVAYYRAAHRVCTVLLEADALESTFDAALRIALGWPTEDPERARTTELLTAQVSPERFATLRGSCARLGPDAQRLDLGTWRRAVELTCCRAGLLSSGDLGGTAWMVRWLPERRRLPAEDAIDDLLGYWSSSNHARLRQQIGIAAPR